MTSKAEAVVLDEPGSAERGALPGPPPRASKDSSLGRRILSGAVFLPLLIGMAWVGGPVYLGFTLLLVALALWEFYHLMAAKGLTPHWKSGFAAALIVPVGVYVRLRANRIEEWHVAGLLTVLLVAVLLAGLRRGAGKQTLVNAASTLLGVFYVGWLGSHVCALRELPRSVGEPYSLGMSFALLPFFLAWTCDTAAYAVGRRFGRHRLAPSVSPHKSVEGAIGGFVATVGAALVARAWFAAYLSSGEAVVLGGLVGVFAQLGDLVESLLKRDAEATESSNIIPGHGGVLDRFDSILFAAPLVYYFLLLQIYSR